MTEVKTKSLRSNSTARQIETKNLFDIWRPRGTNGNQNPVRYLAARLVAERFGILIKMLHGFDSRTSRVIDSSPARSPVRPASCSKTVQEGSGRVDFYVVPEPSKRVLEEWILFVLPERSKGVLEEWNSYVVPEPSKRVLEECIFYVVPEPSKRTLEE